MSLFHPKFCFHSFTVGMRNSNRAYNEKERDRKGWQLPWQRETRTLLIPSQSDDVTDGVRACADCSAGCFQRICCSGASPCLSPGPWLWISPGVGHNRQNGCLHHGLCAHLWPLLPPAFDLSSWSPSNAYGAMSHYKYKMLATWGWKPFTVNMEECFCTFLSKTNHTQRKQVGWDVVNLFTKQLLHNISKKNFVSLKSHGEKNN